MREGKLEGSGQTDRVYPSASGEDEEVQWEALAVEELTSLQVGIPEMAGRTHHLLALIHAISCPKNLLRTRPNLGLRGESSVID